MIVMILLTLLVITAEVGWITEVYKNKSLSELDDQRLSEIGQYKLTIQGLHKQLRDAAELSRNEIDKRVKVETLYTKQTELYNRAIDKLQKYNRLRGENGKFKKKEEQQKVKPVYKFIEKDQD